MTDPNSAVAMVNDRNEPLGVRVQLVERNDKPGGLQLVNPNMVNKNNDPSDLVALAQQVQKADEFIKAGCGSKLTVIADQIRYLQEQAKKVLEEAKRDHDLHHAACNLVKKPGNIYYLYRRASGQAYFSLLSPEEWGASCPHEFLEAYRLEYDQSWTPLKDIEKRSTQNILVDKIINHQLAITDSSNPLGFTVNGTNGKTTVEELKGERPA